MGLYGERVLPRIINVVCARAAVWWRLPPTQQNVERAVKSRRVAAPDRRLTGMFRQRSEFRQSLILREGRPVRAARSATSMSSRAVDPGTRGAVRRGGPWAAARSAVALAPTGHRKCGQHYRLLETAVSFKDDNSIQ
jgi:hypothetical protein